MKVTIESIWPRAVRCVVTCLASNIVEVVVTGREPSGLSLGKLVKGMPIAWEEQRNALAC